MSEGGGYGMPVGVLFRETFRQQVRKVWGVWNGRPAFSQAAMTASLKLKVFHRRPNLFTNTAPVDWMLTFCPRSSAMMIARRSGFDSGIRRRLPPFFVTSTHPSDMRRSDTSIRQMAETRFPLAASARNRGWANSSIAM